MENNANTYYIVRGTNSGLFFGKVRFRSGSEAVLTDCRRLWYWDGACSDFQIAMEGVKNTDDCKFTVTVPEITLTDVIELIPCTETAVKVILEVPEWKR